LHLSTIRYITRLTTSVSVLLRLLIDIRKYKY